MEYGDYNLRIFEEETYEQLSPKGKVWLTRTRNNLQDAMENLLMSDDGASLELNDNTFTQMAMATHANAYWSAGLGELPLMDLVKIGLSPDIKHLATGASVSQISEISMLLLDYWKKHPMTGAQRGWEAITHMREIRRLVQEYMMKQSVQLGGYPNKEYNENRKAINAIVHKLGIIVDIMP